jgi:hypothetical protein
MEATPISGVPFQDLHIEPRLPNLFTMLTPANAHYMSVCTIIQAASTAAWTRIGGTINPPPLAPANPNLPVPPATFGPDEITALITGLASNNAKAPSMTEAEMLSQVQSSATRYTFAFSSLIPNARHPHMEPTVTPATLDASFTKLLETTNNTNAQRELTELIGVELRHVNESDQRLDAAVTLVKEVIDSVFTAAIKNNTFATSSLNQDPSVAKTKIGMITFPTPQRKHTRSSSKCDFSMARRSSARILLVKKRQKSTKKPPTSTTAV